MRASFCEAFLPTRWKARLLLGMLLLMPGCGNPASEPLVIEPLSTPDGGEIWSVAERGGQWIAIGPGGIFSSAEGGERWQWFGENPSGTSVSLVIAGEALFAVAADFGVVFRSVDGGRKWTQLPQHRGIGGTVVAMGEAVFTASSDAVLRSVDVGNTWHDTAYSFPRRQDGFVHLVQTARGLYATDGAQAAYTTDGLRWTSVAGPLANVSEIPPPRLRTIVPIGDTLIMFAGATRLRSTDWIHWQSDGEPTPAANRRARVRQLMKEQRERLCLPSPGGGACSRTDGTLHELRELGGWRVASTSEGVYRSRPAGPNWERVVRGIPAPVTALAPMEDGMVALANERLFHKQNGADQWSPLPIAFRPITGLWASSRVMIATTEGEIIRCDGPKRGGCEGGRLSVAALPDTSQWRIAPGSLTGDGRRFLLVGSYGHENLARVILSDDRGASWRAGPLPADEALGVPALWDSRLLLRDSVLFAMSQEDEHTSLWATRDWGASWREILEGPRQDPTAVALLGDAIVVAAADRLTKLRWQGDSLAAENLPANGVNETIRHLWVDPEFPRVIIAATDSSVFWSTDGGDHFARAAARADVGRPTITGLVDTGDRRILLTTRGMYALQDQLPRTGGVGRVLGPVLKVHQRYRDAAWYKWLLGVAGVAGAYTGGLLALVLLAWRRGSAVLGRSPLRRIARRVLLEAPGLARWALFLGYARRARREESIQEAGRDFFGPPAEYVDGSTILPEAEGKSLVEQITRALKPQSPLLIVGSGGAGKTRLLSRLAWLALNRKLADEFRGYRPVFVPAEYYRDGDLAGAIASVLCDRYGVDVSGETLRKQLETGNFLILFDGASEIDSPSREAAFAELVRQMQSHAFARCRFVVTSRPFASLRSTVPTIHLNPLTADIVSVLLPRYRLGPVHEARVRRQLQAFGSRPIAPLLFKMAVEDRAKDGEGTSRSSLYERYFRRLLQVEGAGGRFQWAGWRMALGEIACWSLLETGTRGVGLSHELLVTRLLQPSPEHEGLNIPERLAQFFDVPVPVNGAALHILKQLGSAGILDGGPPRRWRFAHDTFEEYFAAVHLSETIAKTGGWPDLPKWRENAERVAEFCEVVSFATQIHQGELFPGAAEQYPQEWLRIG